MLCNVVLTVTGMLSLTGISGTSAPGSPSTDMPVTFTSASAMALTLNSVEPLLLL